MAEISVMQRTAAAIELTMRQPRHAALQHQRSRFSAAGTAEMRDRKGGRVATNSVTLHTGSAGRAVHLVQMALLDLGYAMPNSAGNANYSPDGIYGEETKRVAKQFQKESRALIDDGVVGQKTIQELDRPLNAFKHRVKLHFRSIALTNVPFQRTANNPQLTCGHKNHTM